MTGGIVGLVAALAVGDPAPAIIGSLLLALAIVGLAGGETSRLEVSVSHLPISAVEGVSFEFEVRLEPVGTLGRTLIDLRCRGVEIVGVVGGRRLDESTVALGRVRETLELKVTAVATSWGRPSIGPFAVSTDSPLGMFDVVVESGHRQSIVVVPEESTIRALLSPLETNLHVGDLVSNRRGIGSEFADLRPFQTGDDPRAVNWRVSSRFGEKWVNERHPERNGDVVIMIDGQVESGTAMTPLVDRSVRMAAALLQAHGRRHHRLGLVTVDGLCRWVYPGMGELHRRRLLEQLMGVTPGEVVWEAAQRAVLRAARRPSMVIALTPLLDPEMAGVIHGLRRSGVDISVVEIELEHLLSPPDGAPRELGRRIWAMERDRLRDRLVSEGIPIVTWRGPDPPDVPLAELSQWRTAWRRRLG
ncbi:MAG: DUF58 domain-containing protein [Acidimicrobiia bacterium]